MLALNIKKLWGRNDASHVFKLYILSLYLPTLLSNEDIMYAVCEEDRIKMENRLQKRAYNNILWRLSSLLNGRLLGKLDCAALRSCVPPSASGCQCPRHRF